jgi:hypothetical protein
MEATFGAAGFRSTAGTANVFKTAMSLSYGITSGRLIYSEAAHLAAKLLAQIL